MMNNLKIPQHTAIIMDGNGRWATARNLPRSAGHKAGAERISDLLKSAKKFNIPFVTVYAFSTENWKRPQPEVDALMTLLDNFLTSYTGKLMQENVRLFVIGRLEQLSNKLQKKIAEAIEKTSKNTGLTFTIALNYGGRSEIADSAKKIAIDIQSGKISPADIDEKLFSTYLYQPELPDVDLLIRTSGELRISNFLLWQISYAEIFVTPTLWPDFDENTLLQAITAFNSRDRRLGGLNK
ncbi:MAG: isoprenyl transferase [Lentisphaeria bacterium]|nr:isoprenyl transferase [Lentisphaeria bacterium]